MTALFVVVPLALLVSAAFLWAFVWSVKRGQMDDLATPALRILEDDDETRSIAPPAQQASKPPDKKHIH